MALKRRWSGEGIGVWLVLGLILALGLGVTLFLVFGGRLLFVGEGLDTYLSLKTFGALELAQGRIPALFPSSGLDQVFRGDPTAQAFYPGNFLFLILPFWSAFHLYCALHWLWAGLGMAALARGLRQRPVAAWLAGVTYAGSGWMLSSLSLYNSVAVIAWWPWVMLGVVKGGRRGLLLGGAACGMALLGGDPMLALLGLVPLGWVALLRRPVRRALGWVAGVMAVGLVVSLPQWVATLRSISSLIRSRELLESAASLAFHPMRLVELVIPFPRGRPMPLSAEAVLNSSGIAELPEAQSLYFGIVALGLVLLVVSRHRSAALLAGAGWFGAWLAGLGEAFPLRLIAGLEHHPEKFLFWSALALALLAGWGLERALERQARFAVGLALASAATGLLALLVHFGPSSWWIGALEAGYPSSLFSARIDDPTSAWVLALLFSMGLLALMAWSVHKGWALALLALQVVSLLQLAPLVQSVAVEPFLEWGIRPTASWKADLLLDENASQSVAGSASGHVEALALSADRMEFLVQSSGSVLVVERDYSPLWKAQAQGRDLEVFAAQDSLLGVSLPPGSHRVVLSVSQGPEILAACVGGLGLLACLGFAGWNRGYHGPQGLSRPQRLDV